MGNRGVKMNGVDIITFTRYRQGIKQLDEKSLKLFNEIVDSLDVVEKDEGCQFWVEADRGSYEDYIKERGEYGLYDTREEFEEDYPTDKVWIPIMVVKNGEITYKEAGLMQKAELEALL